MVWKWERHSWSWWEVFLLLYHWGQLSCLLWVSIVGMKLRKPGSVLGMWLVSVKGRHGARGVGGRFGRVR